MRRTFYKKYIFFALFLLALLTLPPFFVQKMRSSAMVAASPIWRGISKIKGIWRGKKYKEDVHKLHLESENHLLKLEVARLRSLLEEKASLKRGELKSLTARVIYRDQTTWASSLWINVGEETNAFYGRKIVEKNSPVLYGKALAGVIDYVGKKQSRVRLITDPVVKPSVRVVRGSFQNIHLIEHLDSLIKAFQTRDDVPFQDKAVVKKLDELRKHLSENGGNWFLAKGIVQGAGATLWRNTRAALKGIGFNSDFADEKSGARDLLTGAPIDPHSTSSKVALIKEGDILITTGLDGVFPAGLKVAEVTKVLPLREGAFSYEIEAKAAAGNLDELQTLFVIPSIGFSREEVIK